MSWGHKLPCSTPSSPMESPPPCGPHISAPKGLQRLTVHPAIRAERRALAKASRAPQDPLHTLLWRGTRSSVVLARLRKKALSLLLDNPFVQLLIERLGWR